MDDLPLSGSHSLIIIHPMWFLGAQHCTSAPSAQTDRARAHCFQSWVVGCGSWFARLPSKHLLEVLPHIHEPSHSHHHHHHLDWTGLGVVVPQLSSSC